MIIVINIAESAEKSRFIDLLSKTDFLLETNMTTVIGNPDGDRYN
jgi:hypothetical protein